MAMMDHQPAFKELFKLTKVNKMLEFGLGESTKFFAKNCNSVISVEFSMRQEHMDWFREVEKWNIQNWGGDMMNVGDTFTDAIRQYTTIKLDEELYDLAFVDPGVHWRPEIVNLCFNNVPIVAAHDTGAGAYGWERVEVPPQYSVVEYQKGVGTTFWILDKILALQLEKAFAETD